MEYNKKIFFFILSLFISGLSYAQVNRYMVFFTDKNNSGYSLARPDEFLSQRAIDRRSRYQIPVTIQDFPVNKPYVDDLENQGIDVFYRSRWFNGVLVQMDENMVSTVEAMPTVNKVEFVAPGERLIKNSALRSAATSNETTSRKSALTNALQNNMLGVEIMHEDGFTGNNILIGIFDAGFNGVDQSIYFNHLFERGKILATRDFIRNSDNVFQYDDHGTGVLSTIAGYEESVYEGIAYESGIILCVTEDVPTEYVIEEYNWLFAAEYADSLGVDIINTSLGYNTFDDPSMNYTYDDMNGDVAVITRATDLAASKGIVCVVSVGNEGNNSWQKLVAPADADSALAVGAVNQNLEYINFSSTGPTSDNRIKPDVVALGQGTKIVQYNGELATGSGTSFASPLIAGLAAGLWQIYPELNNMELIDLIRRGSSQFQKPDTLLGYGVPDYSRIRSLITALEDEPLASSFNIYPNPVDNKKLFVEYLGGSNIETVQIDIFDVKGGKVFELNTKYFDYSPKIELDLSGIKRGVYILNLLYGKFQGNAKIIIP
jgi:serine protease AprX